MLNDVGSAHILSVGADIAFRNALTGNNERGIVVDLRDGVYEVTVGSGGVFEVEDSDILCVFGDDE